MAGDAHLEPDPRRVAVRPVKTFPTTLKAHEYGVLLRTIGLLALAKARERRAESNGLIMWAHAVMWFELARYVDPKGTP
jgi:hypothetical protein